jgi:SdpC family antimicrobial peptide
MKKLILPCLLTIGLLAAVTTPMGAPAAHAASPADSRKNSPVSTARYSGEDIFRAVVFGQGTLARGLGGLVEPVPATPEVQLEIDRLSSKMSTLDPTFFADFATRAQSGDVFQVSDAFEDLDAHVSEALSALGYTSAARDGSITPQCITVVLFAAAALVVGGVAVLTVAAVATTALYSTKTKVISGPSATEGLSKEKLLMSLTSALDA